MAISAVGALQGNTGTNLLSFTLTTTTAGNCVMLGVYNDTAATVTGVSSTGTTWSRIAGPWNDPSFAGNLEIWLGTVVTPGASKTVTVTYSAAMTSNYIEYDAQEFTNGDTTTTWALDGTYSVATNTKDNATAGATCTFPTLAPGSGNTDLYFGKAVLTTGMATTGQLPSSFTVKLDASASDGIIYNPSISASVSPTVPTSSSSASGTMAVLVKATVSGGGGGGGGTPTITHKGTIATTGSAGPPTTISITTLTAGDLVVLTDATSSGTSYATAVTGGGVNSWQLVALNPSTTGITVGVTMWVGTVSTPGTATVTVTRTGTPGGCQIDVDQFTAGLGASTVWVVESSGIVAATTGTTTMSYPTLSASVAGSLYCGYAVTSGNGSAGSTSGFTYNVDNYFVAVRCYSTTVAVGSVSPTATTAGTANQWCSLGALFTATLPTAIGRSFPIRQAVVRASTF